MLEETNKSLDDRQREIETLNHLIARLQIDYEKSKNDLSTAHDQLVQHEISNQTLKQHLIEKTNEVKSLMSINFYKNFSILDISHYKSSSSNSTRFTCI